MYLFLDCDGVINQMQPNFHVDAKCVGILADIVSMYGCKIVLASTWRFGFCHQYARCSPQVRNLIDIFRRFGLEVYGRTKDLGDRTGEILLYLDEHGVEEYLILDDDRSLFSDTGNLYLVNPRTGLVKSDIKKIKDFMR